MGIHAGRLLDYLRDHLANKTIEFEVEGNGRRFKVKATNRQELEMAIQKAREFIM